MQEDLAKNHFELFGLPAVFDIDTVDLASRYRELQRRFHPDKFASASDQERRLSMQVTAQINDAYRVLKDPLRRGRYLLKMVGVDTEEETNTVMEPEFLMEQMELREQLAEVRNQAQPLEALLALAAAVKQRSATRIAELQASMAQNDSASRDKSRKLLREMQFLEKLAQEIELLEEELL